MKRYSVVHVFLMGAILFHCAGQNRVEKTTDGIIVRLNNSDARTIKLQVVSDEIIHVLASPTDTFSTSRSLMTLSNLKLSSNWQVEENKDYVSVITPKLRVHVLLSTGEIAFYKSTGQELLKERIGGGKSFQLVTAEGQQAFSIRQVFESPADEAFYGLGAHQNGQMNYKGDDVDLVQQNIVDVVPFLYSSKNYGILWDNYSISKFGDPREYQSLDNLILFDKNASPGGLTADYYVNDQLKNSRVEHEINYEFLETPQVENFPKDVSRNGKVVWTGSFSSEHEGAHKFLAYSSGYIKIWIDKKLVVDKWRQNWNPWTNKFKVELKKGERHDIKIEWKPDDGGYLAVKHLDPYPDEEQNKLSFTSELADEINYYFIAGETADDVISGYRELTGKAPIIPKWAAGFWQSRERYTNQNDLLNVVKEYRKRRIPLDNIVLDWQYWEDPKWGSHEFDASRFPDPEGMVDEIHSKLNAHIMISVWPKFNKGTANFDEMNKNGFLFTRNIEKGRKDWVGSGYVSTFYDPFNENAGKLFWKQIDKNLNALNFDAWWLDATEPDMHSNLSVEERKGNMSPTALGPGARFFNAYSLMNAKSVFEGQRKSNPDKRVFILTRSAYAGQQRYGAVTWSGDIVSRWSDFKDQIAAGINFSLSGIPYWTMDIGGFAVERKYYRPDQEALREWRELNTRWFQFGAFCPVFRSHGQYPFREIYNIAEAGSTEYNSMVYYDKLRYQLLPYVYSLAGQTYWNDYTIMRGLVMDFGDDSKVLEVNDQYMFGPSLLISPVYEYNARQRSVYLPAGTGWYDFYTGQYFEGGNSTIANAPLERMPLYVREGSILPLGPEIQFTAEKTDAHLDLYVFTGKDAAFTLYEDEGSNNNYEQGHFSTIPIYYKQATGTLVIGERSGSFPSMIPERTIRVVWVTKNKPVGVGISVSPHRAVHYTGSEIAIKINP